MEHLSAKGIRNPTVLRAIGRVPRHFFFDQGFLSHAYEDKAFPIGEAQTISQPYTVAFQSALLDCQPHQRVLEIGTGSGYQCCVLLEMEARVFTVEYHRSLYEHARSLLRRMGYYPHFFHGDGSVGLRQHAPYDAIIVTAGLPRPPAALLAQLRVGGRLVAPVGGRRSQEMHRIWRTSEHNYTTERFGQFRFVPLLGKEGWQ